MENNPIFFSKDGFNYCLSDKCLMLLSCDSNLGSIIKIPQCVQYLGNIINVGVIYEDAFKSNLDLVILEIPDSVLLIYIKCFMGLKYLKKIIVDKNNTIYNSIDGCLYSLTKNLLWVPQGIEGELIIPDGTTKIGFECFIECMKISKIYIPKSIETIGSRFINMNCKLEIDSQNPFFEIEEDTLYRLSDGKRSLNYIPPEKIGTVFKVSRRINYIDSFVFINNYKLKILSIENSNIGKRAFLNCEELETVLLGSEIKQISEIAFGGNNKISSIYCFSINPELISTSEKAFAEISINSCTLHIPQNCIDLYKTLPPWNSFYNIVDDINPNESFEEACNKIIANNQCSNKNKDLPELEYLDDDRKSYKWIWNSLGILLIVGFLLYVSKHNSSNNQTNNSNNMESSITHNNDSIIQDSVDANKNENEITDDVNIIISDQSSSPITLYYEIHEIGYEDIQEWGILYGTTSDLDINDCQLVDWNNGDLKDFGNSIPSTDNLMVKFTDTNFESKLKLMHLFGNTRYYLRPFAILNNSKLLYGKIQDITTSNYSRSPKRYDEANVYWSGDYDLFDLQTDEIIPLRNGYYDIFTSSNESPKEVNEEYLQVEELSKNTMYKFKSIDNYKLWYNCRE